MIQIKVLHIVAGMDPKQGGVCQAVRMIISGLNSHDVSSEVVSLDAVDTNFSKEDQFPVYCLGPGKGPWSYSSELVPWLVQHSLSYQVIIVHGLWLFHSYAIRKAMKMLGEQRILVNNTGEVKTFPKFFVMPHGMLDPYFQKAKGRKLKALRNWVYWKLIERKVVNSADGLLFTSEDERLVSATTFTPYHPKEEKVVGLGMEEPPAFTAQMREAFLAKCPGIKDRRFLLFLGRIDTKKGVDILIEGYFSYYESLLGSGVDSEALPRLVIAGPGLDTPYGQKMQQLAQSSARLQSLVYFPGMLAGDAKWGAFYTSEAFILASHQENFGIAIVEALACKKPVLISDKINIWREIRQHNGGLVADDSVVGTLQNIKIWHHLSTNEKTIMGENARQVYIDHFSIQPATARLAHYFTKATTNEFQ